MRYRYLPHILTLAIISTGVLLCAMIPAHANNFELLLLNGDADGDNVLSIGDAGVPLSCENAVPGDECWNPAGDIDGDGVLSIGDAGIILWYENHEGVLSFNGTPVFPSGSYELFGTILLDAWAVGIPQPIDVTVQKEGVSSSYYFLTVTAGTPDIPVRIPVSEAGNYTVRAKSWHWTREEVTGVSVTALSAGSAVSPATATATPITVTYSGASENATVRLWYKKGYFGTWAQAGCDPQTGASGQFSFTDAADNGVYYFDLVAQDGSGNQTAPPGTEGDDNTFYCPSISSCSLASILSMPINP